jgi:hypothetical protein
MKENIEEILKKALEQSQVEWPESDHEARFVDRLQDQRRSKTKVFNLSLLFIQKSNTHRLHKPMKWFTQQ